MNVKRFIGTDNNDAMLKVKRELGSEAVILHTRKIRQKGIRGFFKKPLVEIVAAIDDSTIVVPKNDGDGAKLLAEMRSYGVNTSLNKTSKKETIVNGEKAEVQSVETATTEALTIEKDVAEQKQDIADLKSQISELKAMITEAVVKPNKEKQEQDFWQHAQIKNLLAHDIEKEILEQIEIEFNQENIDLSDEEEVKLYLSQYLEDLIGENFDADSKTSEQKIYYFVGPTGVGKTTTIAKIAAKLTMMDNKKLSLVTADTYRIAAVDQLKTYGEILSIPLDVIYEAEDMEKVLDKKADYDYILVDTAGRNHKDEEMRSDLEALLAQTKDHEVFLVISCTSSVRDVKRIIKSYQFIEDYHLIFTKLDEAETYGNILNGKVLSKKDLAFITNGQSVPDDIIPATPKRVADLLLEEIDE